MRRPHLPLVMGGTVVALAMAFLLGVVLPVTDAALGSQAAGSPREYTAEQVLGRKIYLREGCFTCHTQMVRDAQADAQLGSMSQPGLYGNEAPSLIGLDRVGPDLACFGDRAENMDVEAHLRHPSRVHEGSAMPSYAFLSERELRALASYLTALTCEAE